MASPFLLLVLAEVAALSPRLRVQHVGVPAETRAFGAFEAQPDGSFRSILEARAYTATLIERPGGLLHGLTLEIRYKRPVTVMREWLELDLPGTQARAVGRDGQLRELPPRLYVDQWMVKLLEVKARERTTVLLAGSAVQALSIERAAARVVARLEIDDVANHPFEHESLCRPSWRTAAPRRDSSARVRRASETATYDFRLGTLADKPPLLVPQRFPNGYAAAFAFTDHADQSSYETLRALLYGSSEAPLEPGTRGLMGHALRITKALFFESHGAARPQLDDPRVQALALQMVHAGHEVVPHTATPRKDERPVTERALAFFASLGARNWIDHQIETNCEAVTNRGLLPGQPFYIADLLGSHGFRYLWAGRDPETPGGTLDLLATDHPAARTPWLYAHGPPGPGAPSFWLWQSQWAYVNAPRFFAAYQPAALDRLEAQHGLYIGHTYLESLHERGRHRTKAVLVRKPDGTIETSAAFEALLAELERRQSRGSLFVAPVGTIADHAIGMSQVDVEYATSGARIRSHAPQPVRGATFAAEVPILIDGAPPPNQRSVGATHLFWLDLEPERTYVVTVGGRS